MTDKLKLVKKNDFLIIAICLLSALLLLCLSLALSSRQGGVTAHIYKSGEELYAIELDKVTSPYEIKIDGVVLLIKKGEAGIISSNCSDLLCVKKGMLSRVGQSSCCLPAQLVLKLSSQGDRGLDAVVY